MSRELPNWLESYLVYTENSEPPRSYHTWCALSLIAGALQRKVYLQWGFERIYPNLFVVLVGPSGRARKGVALGIGKTMLANISGVSMAPEASSREAVILAMKRAMMNFEDPTDGHIKFHCSLTAFSEELSVLLGQSDIKLLSNLTDWYDSKEDWAYETVGRGRDALQGLCFNLLGATAPEWLQSMLPQEAIGGGFTSRVIFVVEERKGKTVPDHQLTKAETDLEASLIRDLERINQLRGKFTFSAKARQAYVDWYTEQDALLLKGQMAVDDMRFAGYCERRQTHLRKIVMLLSACRGDSLEVTMQDFQEAKAVLEMTEVKMAKTFGGLGQARYSDATERILDFIKLQGSAKRSELLVRFYRDIDSFTLQSIENTMMQMKVIKVELIIATGDKLYTWIGR